MNSKENRLLIKNGIFLKKKIKNVVVEDSSYYYGELPIGNSHLLF